MEVSIIIVVEVSQGKEEVQEGATLEITLWNLPVILLESYINKIVRDEICETILVEQK